MKLLRTRGRLNPKRAARALADRLRGTAFDRALARASREGVRDFVFAWNRGLGDVALGLVPLFAQIREQCPGARITVYTREDLGQVFALADVDRVHIVPRLERGRPVDFAVPGIVAPEAGAVVFAEPDPTRWLEGRRQRFAPVLRWEPHWNGLADRFLPRPDGRVVIGAHVHSETAQHYGYAKDWPTASWRALFARYAADDHVQWVLFGTAATVPFVASNVVDLRGRTDFVDMLAVIVARCRVLLAPDSGILTAAYYLDQPSPLEIISLWSDPRQGVLKQGCPSPNPSLRHTALIGDDEDVRNIPVDRVQAALDAALSRVRTEHR